MARRDSVAAGRGRAKERSLAAARRPVLLSKQHAFMRDEVEARKVFAFSEFYEVFLSVLAPAAKSRRIVVNL